MRWKMFEPLTTNLRSGIMYGASSWFLRGAQCRDNELSEATMALNRSEGQ